MLPRWAKPLWASTLRETETKKDRGAEEGGGIGAEKPLGSQNASCFVDRLNDFEIPVTSTFSHFFFLQCRTSTRHGRSTTGNCKDCFRKSPWKQNPRQKQHPHNQTNTKTTQTTNTHTKAKRQPGNTTREICKLGETR